MADMPWREAIIKVLAESGSAMHYSDIAERIVEDGLRVKVGATPASTVNANISWSIKDEGEKSPFIRVGRGEYFLRSESGSFDTPGPERAAGDEVEEDRDASIIQAFGMFWQRELVLWSNNPSLLGRQQIGADPVDFSKQSGVYLLYDDRDVIYVGRSSERPLGTRLYEHTQDRLRGRWNRFSWFGLRRVTDCGELGDEALNPTRDSLIATLEALLIEGLEPPQNRRRGDNFTAIEYIQAENPEIEKQHMKALLSEMQSKLGG